MFLNMLSFSNLPHFFVAVMGTLSKAERSAACLPPISSPFEKIAKTLYTKNLSSHLVMRFTLSEALLKLIISTVNIKQYLNTARILILTKEYYVKEKQVL